MAYRPQAQTQFLADVDAADKPSTGVALGDRCFCVDTQVLYRCISIGPVVWLPIGCVVSKRLSADLSNSTTTLAKVTNLDIACGVGTWGFKYIIRYQAAATTTGVRFSVNHNGTVSVFLAHQRFVSIIAADATAGASQAEVLSTAAPVRGFSARAKSTTGWSSTISVDAANSDMLMIIEGLVVVTAAGNLELWHGSEVARGVHGQGRILCHLNQDGIREKWDNTKSQN